MVINYSDSTVSTCPFCGSAAYVSNMGPTDWFVTCDNCAAATTTYDTPKQAIRAWEKRADRIPYRRITSKKTLTLEQAVVYCLERNDIDFANQLVRLNQAYKKETGQSNF